MLELQKLILWLKKIPNELVFAQIPQRKNGNTLGKLLISRDNSLAVWTDRIKNKQIYDGNKTFQNTYWTFYYHWACISGK